ncbi:15213_t:CDS:2 [Acaulospora colombiana]|uniref:15213_t:CDS:1 n=1 Tax=Acaulospora colombiana TaxID=27376 RepID=A0ACA9PZX0_9GLOM|nr:15213_t:CDS:2 [Acaulospora colombiana]
MLHIKLRRTPIVEIGKNDLASQEGSVEATSGDMRIWVMTICRAAVKIGYCRVSIRLRYVTGSTPTSNVIALAAFVSVSTISWIGYGSVSISAGTSILTVVTPSTARPMCQHNSGGQPAQQKIIFEMSSLMPAYVQQKHLSWSKCNVLTTAIRGSCALIKSATSEQIRL